MFAHPLRSVLSFYILATLLSFHPDEVQSMSISGMAASLSSRRNMESQNDHVDEEDQLKILSKLLDSARNKKSVTFAGEDSDNGDEEAGRSVGLKRVSKVQDAPSFEEWKRAYLLKSSGGREAREQKNHVELKDRDYFQAIGLSPGGYESSNSYPSYSGSKWGNNEY